MKKFLFAIMLVLALVVVAPAAVAAAPEKTRTVDLEMFVAAVDRQTADPIPVGLNQLKLTGTVTYTGQVTSVNLSGVKDDAKLVESLMDAKLVAVEKFDYVISYNFSDPLDPTNGNILQGSGTGTLRLIDKNDAKNVPGLKDLKDLKGLKKLDALKKIRDFVEGLRSLNYMAIKFQSDIQGNIYTGPASDIGTWEVSRTFGSYFRLNNAKGNWVAMVALVDITGDNVPDTFAGTASCTGTY